MRASVSLVVALLLYIEGSSASFRCSDRTPEGRFTSRAPVENKFQIKISGNPRSYESGEKYTVSLQGVKQFKTVQKFTGFFLTVQPSESSDWDGRQRDVGSFHPMLGDALTQISEYCPNAVTNSSSIYKSEIQVFWKAPSSGNGCVTFKATVVEDRYMWYMDEGPLSLTLCEDMQENINEQPKVLKKCCACDEAKYEVTFEGLWSRHTHPKDFPSNGWLTRFSDIIGASHSSDYRFWQYGEIASEGLRQVAETGSTRMLETELKSESEHIRTIIKARGISYPNITGKTFAVFRVDRKHHLMSLVSMIDPSPDWIVGVSGLELCLENCSWIEFKVLNLFPWDAGTDSGSTYISPDSPTNPREPIRQITTRFPKDEANPFYDPTGGEMKPFARLYLNRQRLYEKSCSDDSTTSDEENISKDCAVGGWSNWDPCSVTCGRGVKYRQRSYLNPLADVNSCKVSLTSKMSCTGKVKNCRNLLVRGENLDTWRNDPSCQVTEWTDWSPCSATCRPSVRTRSRKYKNRNAKKKCLLLPGAQDLEQTDDCYFQDDCEGGKENCPMTTWSEWSPCSATCGPGKKIRTRQRMSYYDPEYRNSNKEDICSGVETIQEVNCEGENPNCEALRERAKEICHLPMDPGPCNGQVERWYFDSSVEYCKQFLYTGCKGNNNSFHTKEICEEACALVKGSTKSPFGGLVAGSQILNKNVTDSLPDTIPTRFTFEGGYDVTDCKTTPWSRWSACNTSCGPGVKEKSRQILVYPQNGGKPCPILLKRKTCRGRYCRGEQRDCILSEWSEWSPCSATCGIYAQKQRTKDIIRPAGPLGGECPPRIETQYCNLLPCNH